ncbi:hypothetical protein ABBQ38_002368 [Trebouxia sp. C0009 RCD-2024]
MANLKFTPAAAVATQSRVGFPGLSPCFDAVPHACRARVARARHLTVITARSTNDNRSDQMNPNNPAYGGSRGGSDGHDDNHANQLNPNNPNYAGSPDTSPGSNDDNRANQLNPNNPNYAGEHV